MENEYVEQEFEWSMHEVHPEVEAVVVDVVVVEAVDVLDLQDDREEQAEAGIVVQDAEVGRDPDPDPDRRNEEREDLDRDLNPAADPGTDLVEIVQLLEKEDQRNERSLLTNDLLHLNVDLAPSLMMGMHKKKGLVHDQEVDHDPDHATKTTKMTTTTNEDRTMTMCEVMQSVLGAMFEVTGHDLSSLCWSFF